MPMTIVKLSTASPIVWSDGSNFNGYLVSMLSPPLTAAPPSGINWPGDGVLTFMSAEAWSQTGQMRLPDVQVIPIYEGQLSSNVGVFPVSQLSPPGAKYYLYYYDIARKRIAAPASASDFYTFNTSGVITQPTLPVPTAPTSVPSPDA